MGVCMNFPRKLVHSTLDYIGLDIKHLFLLQEIMHIKDIILHNFNATLTGQLYRASMELFFIKLGITPSLLLTRQKAVDCLTTPSLVKSTMTFLAQHNILLKHSIRMPPQRTNDQLIMEALLDTNVSGQELVTCNHCRLYLKVCYLSDITTGDGLYITEEAWIGKYSAHASKDRSWPSYNRPPASSWKTWQKWVNKAFLSRGRHLKHPLGSWLHWDDLWQWYASREGQLHSLLDGIWYSHEQISKRNGRPLFKKDAQVCDPPFQPLYTTVYFKGDRIVVT